MVFSGVRTLKKISEKVRSITKNKDTTLAKKRQNGSNLENLGLDGSNLENLDLDNISVSNQAIIIIIFVLLIIIILLLINATNSTIEPDPQPEGEPEPEPACSCSNPPRILTPTSGIIASGTYGTEGTCTCFTINEDCNMNGNDTANTGTVNIYGDLSIENPSVNVEVNGIVNIYGDLYLNGYKSFFRVSNTFNITGNVYLIGTQSQFYNQQGTSILDNDIILNGDSSSFTINCRSTMTVNNITFNNANAVGIINGNINNNEKCYGGSACTPSGTLTYTSVNSPDQVNSSCCNDCFNITGSSTSS